MKDFIRIAVCQMNPRVSGFEFNSRKMLSMAREAVAKKADMVIFPELAICGYSPEDLLLCRGYVKKCEAALAGISARLPRNAVIVTGAPRWGLERPYNSFAVVRNRRVEYVYDKTRLPNFSVFDEKRIFEPGRRLSVFTMRGKSGVFKFVPTICRDIWEEDFVESAAGVSSGISFMLNISASPYYRGKPQIVVDMVKNYAKRYRQAVVYCNMVGGQDELVYFGGSFVLDKNGEIVMKAPLFQEGVYYADLTEDCRAHGGAGRGINIVAADAAPEREVFDLIVMGIRDYFIKSGYRRAVVGLSGGIDSALVCCLAVEALGKGNVTALFMPTKFTSGLSAEIVGQLARALGIRSITIDADEVYEMFLKLYPGIYSSGAAPTNVEQNLQSRLRGLFLMSYSNKTGALVLATGNKSEYATGYATLYGDIIGAYAPLKDIYKTEVYKLAAFYNRFKNRVIIPKKCISRAPTAELKINQRDSDTLPPYRILDKVLRAFIEENRGISEIHEKTGISRGIVEGVFKMLKNSEFKRKQAPIGPKVSRRAFGKDWRMPINSDNWAF